MSKDSYIRIRLTAEEKQEIKEAAESDRKSISDYILSLVHEEKKRNEFLETYCESIRESINDGTIYFDL